MLEGLGNMAQQNFGNIFAGPQAGAMGQYAGILQQMLGGGAQAQGSLSEGMATGFMPQILASIQAGLEPAADRMFDRGAAQIREQSALSGGLRSTGTSGAISDYRSGLDSQMLQQLAGIQGQLGLGAQQMRGNMTNSALQQLMSGVGTGLQQSNFASQLPLQAMQAIAGGASATPTYQPTFGPSKGEQIFGAATDIGASYMTGGMAGGGGGK
jgi:hypothetical protein